MSGKDGNILVKNGECTLPTLPWISVKEKLPNEAGKYIVVSWSSERKIPHVSIYNWHEGRFFDPLDEEVLMSDGYWTVTHWMPLPEPPNAP